MEFCPKCGSMFSNELGIKKCNQCSYSEKGKLKLRISEIMETQEQVEVISETDEKMLPVVDAKCKKCGNKSSYFWTLQTRAADESETKFFKCTKCGNTWRDYR